VENLLFCLCMLRVRRLCGSCLRLAVLASLPFLVVLVVRGQQASTAPAARGTASDNPEFLATADEVLKDMSEITGLQLKSPLKKSIRSRGEIHAYVLQQMNDEKDAKERYASARSAEAFGLIPKGFNLESFLVDLLTEQIAGLYDPKAHEFYIADWIAPDEQRMVMSHELTHALQDQSFHIEEWAHAARPNDDAEMARETVLEGSAMAAMLDYTLREKGLKLRDLPDIDLSIFIGDLADTPMLKKAPPFIKDSLMFPYFTGLTFSMSVLRTTDWRGFNTVFEKPPANTQQIMHPDLYRANKVAAPLKVNLPEGAPGPGWALLEENSMGEFGWKEILKQFLDDAQANRVAAGWDGDDYATFEQKDTKRLMLYARLRFNTEGAASEFFAAYSDALAKKYPLRNHVMNADSYLAFDAPESSVFFRCAAKECISLEGGNEGLFSQWNKKLSWPSSVRVVAQR